MRFVFAPGHRGDANYAKNVLEGLRPYSVTADRTYDADHFHQTLRDLGADPVIPLRTESSQPHPCNWRLYKERILVGHFLSKLEQFRRVATRYGKLFASFRGFALIAAIVIWLR